MHACAKLLGEAFGLIAFERVALADEDLDKAKELAARRGELLKEAWRLREGYDAAALRAAFVRMEAVQVELISVAEVLQQKYREQQSAGRKQAKYFSTERHLHAASRKAFYCDTQS